MKTCRVCDQTKELTEFGKSARENDGHDTQCSECKRAYNNQWTKNNNKSSRDRNNRWRDKRRNLIHRYKRAKGCLLCPENEPICLDFHHLDPSKKEFNIGAKSFSWSKDRIKLEIEKCVILCRCCHPKVHAGILKLP